MIATVLLLMELSPITWKQILIKIFPPLNVCLKFEIFSPSHSILFHFQNFIFNLTILINFNYLGPSLTSGYGHFEAYMHHIVNFGPQIPQPGSSSTSGTNCGNLSTSESSPVSSGWTRYSDNHSFYPSTNQISGHHNVVTTPSVIGKESSLHDYYQPCTTSDLNGVRRSSNGSNSFFDPNDAGYSSKVFSSGTPSSLSTVSSYPVLTHDPYECIPNSTPMTAQNDRTNPCNYVSNHLAHFLPPPR